MNLWLTKQHNDQMHSSSYMKRQCSCRFVKKNPNLKDNQWLIHARYKGECIFSNPVPSLPLLAVSTAKIAGVLKYAHGVEMQNCVLT